MKDHVRMGRHRELWFQLSGAFVQNGRRTPLLSSPARAT